MEKLLKPDNAVVDKVSRAGLVISRVVIGILWFTQLLWKLPPSFGCPANFAVSTSITARTTGLCDWVGLMSIYSLIPLQASLVKSLVIPNLAWMGWLIFLMEAFVAVTLILGLFTRLGGLVGFAASPELVFRRLCRTGRVVLELSHACHPGPDLPGNPSRPHSGPGCMAAPAPPGRCGKRQLAVENPFGSYHRLSCRSWTAPANGCWQVWVSC